MELIDVFIILGPILVILSGLFIYIFNSLKSDIRESKNDLKDLFRAELRPINEKLDNHITDTDNHITDTDKKIDALDAKITKLNEGQKLILEKLEA